MLDQIWDANGRILDSAELIRYIKMSIIEVSIKEKVKHTSDNHPSYIESPVVKVPGNLKETIIEKKKFLEYTP